MISSADYDSQEIDFRDWPQPAFLPVFTARERYLIVYGGAAAGKCLKKGTKVVMFDGTLRDVERICLGDRLMGPDQIPRTVLKLSYGYGPLYKVKQYRGMDYVVNENHVLSLKKGIEAYKAKGELFPSGNYRRPNGRYPGYSDIVDIPLAEYTQKSASWRRAFHGYRVSVNFEHKETPIAPYFLGLWLGDGHAHETTITTADKEIVDYLNNFASENDVGVNIQQKPDNAAASYHLTNGNGVTVSKHYSDFKSSELLRNKHIPDTYLHNSTEVRLAVLAGVIDSDGSLTHNGYDVIQKSERLARDIQYLCHSLGFHCSLVKTKKTIKEIGFEGLYYRLHIHGETWKIPLKIERKRPDSPHNNKNPYITSIKVEPCGEGEYYGFELDGDHRFLLEDFTVTHNSYAVAQKLILRCLMYPGNRVIAVRKFGPSHDISCWQFFTDHIEAKQIPCSINKTTKTITFSNGSIIKCISIVHTLGEKTDRIKSLTDVTDIWLEEASNDIDKETFELLNMRLRGQELVDNYRQLILTFNPIDVNNWINDYFFIQRASDPDVSIQHYTYKDNIYLDAATKKALEEVSDPNFYDIYTIGEWGRLENQVYPPYSTTYPGGWKQDLFGYQYEDFDATIAGADFGWEHPNAFVLLGIKGRELYVIDELYMRGALNSEFIAAIKEKLLEHIPDRRLHKEIPIYCDAAEPSKIAEMKASDLNPYPAKKDVLDGISAVRQHSIIVNPRAVNFAKEIHGYTRQKDKDGNIQELPDKKRGFDHLMDAMRYAVYTWTLKSRRGGRVIAPVVVGEGEGRWGGLH